MAIAHKTMKRLRAGATTRLMRLKRVLFLKPRIEPKFIALVGMHHKTGSAWMSSVFSKIGQEFGLKLYFGEKDHLPSDFDIFLDGHSKFSGLEQLSGEYRGLHLIRDPRDVIISGCFHHQKATEGWLHVKRENFGGLTYQQKINSLPSLSEKIMFEMEHTASATIQNMLKWNYNNSSFIEVKYEQLISDSNLTLFHEIFVFLGFPGSSIPQALRIAYDNSLFSGMVNNPRHIRSGKARQWKDMFTSAHKTRFLELFGDALIKLGYENNNDWAV